MGSAVGAAGGPLVTKRPRSNPAANPSVQSGSLVHLWAAGCRPHPCAFVASQWLRFAVVADGRARARVCVCVSPQAKRMRARPLFGVASPRTFTPHKQRLFSRSTKVNNSGSSIQESLQLAIVTAK